MLHVDTSKVASCLVRRLNNACLLVAFPINLQPDIPLIKCVSSTALLSTISHLAVGAWSLSGQVSQQCVSVGALAYQSATGYPSDQVSQRYGSPADDFLSSVA